MDAAGNSEMSNTHSSAKSLFFDYAQRLQSVLQSSDWTPVERLAEELASCWREGRQLFLCGNGGSAGNAMHLANDFLYGISKTLGSGIKASALSANPSVLTCLANDVGYDSIFSMQLAVQGRRNDILIALSGSGNSPNIIKVIEQANAMGIRSCAILGYSGGKAKSLAGLSIHFPVDDMQISEDMQLIVGHMIMQQLYSLAASVDSDRGVTLAPTL
jgi:D-sedoheptulose 7-phosphate isomerase